MEELLVSTRIFIVEEFGEPHQSSICLPWSDVQFVEEYVGGIFPEEYDITQLKLYTGETVCILEPFNKLCDIYKKFKESQQNNYLSN